VQFSHFSVKEFLTSNRLATTNDVNISRYHIGLEAAHTILAKACLAELLQLDDKVDETRLGTFPLAFYAAKHWVDHAKFERVASLIRDGMERLFDPTKSHFTAWIWIFDIDEPRPLPWEGPEERPSRPSATPLYYAALCGFHGLAEHLIVVHTQDVNAKGGDESFPLIVAVRKQHLSITRLLCDYGADVKISDDGTTSLHKAAQNGDLEAMQVLLDRGADVNARDNFEESPSWDAIRFGKLEAMQLLLEHGADANSQNSSRWSIPHYASSEGNLEAVRLLLQHHADVNARDSMSQTPLHHASLNGHANVVQLLIEYGADVDAQDRIRCTSLFLASREGSLEVVRVLLRHGADVHVRGEGNQTPVQEASATGDHEIVQLLLEHGAEVEQENSLILSD
jgi:ankyrin repeat protein